MYYNPFNRRQFLLGSGAALALPLLSSLLPKGALANEQAMVRFISMWAPLGGQSATHLYPNYLPEQVLDAYPELGHKFHHTNLRKSDNMDSISKIYSSALNPFMSKLNVIAGLDCPVTSNHGDNTFLGHFYKLRGDGSKSADNRNGMPDVASIDQFLAHHPKIYPEVPTARVGHSGGASMRFNDPKNYNSGTTKTSGDVDALRMFNRFFGENTPSIVEDAASIQRKANSSTLVDQVRKDLNRIKGGSRIGLKDKEKLQNWADEMHELQQKVNKAAATMACAVPDQPAKMISGSYHDYVNGERRYYGSLNDVDRKLHYELLTSVLAAGIKCGRTRIGSLGVSYEKAATDGYSYHEWGHKGNRENIATSQRWTIENILVPLLQKLDVEESGGKTFLDNSIVVYGNISSNVHTLWNRPILTAGSANGFFNTGKYFDYRQRHRYREIRKGKYTKGDFNFVEDSKSKHILLPGVFYNQFLCSIMQAMGLSESDYNILPGVQGYSGVKYGLSGITGGDERVAGPRPFYDKKHADDAGKRLRMLVKGT